MKQDNEYKIQLAGTKYVLDKTLELGRPIDREVFEEAMKVPFDYYRCQIFSDIIDEYPGIQDSFVSEVLRQCLLFGNPTQQFIDKFVFGKYKNVELMRKFDKSYFEILADEISLYKITHINEILDNSIWWLYNKPINFVLNNGKQAFILKNVKKSDIQICLVSNSSPNANAIFNSTLVIYKCPKDKQKDIILFEKSNNK